MSLMQYSIEECILPAAGRCLLNRYLWWKIETGMLYFSPNSQLTLYLGERGGSVVECRTPEREVGGSKPTAAVLCPWARHFTPRKYWLITQEPVAPSPHDWKIVDWDVKPQHKQTNTLSYQRLKKHKIVFLPVAIMTCDVYHCIQSQKSGILLHHECRGCYLTYPYPTRGIDKKRITTRVVNILVV